MGARRLFTQVGAAVHQVDEGYQRRAHLRLQRCSSSKHSLQGFMFPVTSSKSFHRRQKFSLNAALAVSVRTH